MATLTGPEAWMTRRFDALETALHAREMGLGGFVLKNRTYCTQPVALLVRRLVPDIEVFGSLTLDGEVGGLNYRAVRSAAEIGTKVLWLPVFYSANSMPAAGNTSSTTSAAPNTAASRPTRSSRATRTAPNSASR